MNKEEKMRCWLLGLGGMWGGLRLWDLRCGKFDGWC